MRVFISYSRKDVNAANVVSTWLGARGAEVFIDYQEILGTDHFPERLAREIDACDVLLLLLSEHSMASRWVLREVEYADEQQKSVIIVRLDEAALPKALFYLSRREHLDGRELRRDSAISPALQSKLARTLNLRETAPSPPREMPQVGAAPPVAGTAGTTAREGASAGQSRFTGGIAIGLLLVGALAVVLLLLTRQNDGGTASLTMTSIGNANATTIALGNLTATQSQSLVNATQTIDAMNTLIGGATSDPTRTLPPPTATDPPPTETPTPTPTPSASAISTSPASATAEAEGSEPAAETTRDAMLGLMENQVALLDSQTMAINWQPQWEPYEGVDMVKVPAGCFEMGGSPFPDSPSDAEIHIICVQAFWLDRYEVSNEQFTSFNGSAAEPSVDSVAEHPRTHLSWTEARDYCALRGTRLPTEAEWEYAARGPFSANYPYPWGNEFDSTFVNDDGVELAPVDTFIEGMSWVGAYNMAGNAAEWTSSRMRGYPYNAADGREDAPADDSDLRVVRGGSFSIFNLPEYLHSATRISSLSIVDGGLDTFGVRCARDAD